MPRILAIEADSRRQRALTTLVREHVKATLVVVSSVRAAITAIAERAPDLIVAPALLAPSEEAELLAHMKQLDTAPYIQMLTVPALDMLVDAPASQDDRRGLLGQVFNRRPTSLGLQYDRSMVAAQISDGLERARELRMQYATMLAYDEARRSRETALVRISGPQEMAAAAEALGAARADERRIALRKRQGDVPWLSAVKLAWGAELKVINISNTGVLVETGSKLTPGSTTDLHLSGPETNLVMPVRFIRSDVARIDGLGVRYHAAAAFSRELDLVQPKPRARSESTPPHELAALLAEALTTDADRPEPAHARFAQGLRRLIGARDVQVKMGSAGASAGRETLYFDVPGDSRTRTTLQVVFDRQHDVTAEQFKLLKAAAWLTAAVLELDQPASAPSGRHGAMALLSERVA